MADVTVLLVLPAAPGAVAAAGEAVRVVAPAELGPVLAAVATPVAVVVPPGVLPAPDLVARHRAAHADGEVAVASPTCDDVAPPPAGGPHTLRGLRHACVSASPALLARLLAEVPDAALGTRPEALAWLRRHGLRILEGPGGRGADGTAPAAAWGAACARLATARPDLRAEALGEFRSGGDAETLARRVLVGLPGGAGAARAAARLIGRPALERLARHTAFWRGARAALPPSQRPALSGGPAVLMYHGVAEPGERPDRFVVTPRQLRRHLRLLRLLRRRPVPLADLVARLEAGAPLPRRSVAVTFDDGYRDNARVAAPLLARAGVPATFFLVTGRMGEANDWDAGGSLRGRPVMSWSEALALRAHGVALGAHTVRHRRLTELAPDEARAEVMESVRRLAARLGGPAPLFAYPQGRHDAQARAAVAAAGCAGAVATHPGRVTLGSAPLALPRIEMRGTDSTLRALLRLLDLRP